MKALLLLAALVGGIIGGGAVGAIGSMRLLAPPAAAVSTDVGPATHGTTEIAVTPPSSTTVAGDVYRKVSPSVVQVVVSGQAGSGRMGGGSGSGFVVDKNGYILTNQHVVEGGRAISVRFNDGASREAQVAGTDKGNDLALLKVDLPSNISAVPLGDSDRVAVGDVAVAIGSPFGLEQTVTQGIISAVHRTWSPGDGRVRRNLLQTDAPVNPGNSGGPLLNSTGEVVGITSLIESPVRGNVGVAFAIPVNTAKRLLPQLQAGARLEPVWLGITGQPVDAAIARDQGLPVDEGILVLSVVADGPAARAGLRGGQGDANERIARGGDVIVAMDGTPVKDLGKVTEALVGRRSGDTVTLTIIRNGQRQEVRVTLQPWPSA